MTTHRIDAYGGFQAPRGFLERLAAEINSDGLPMSQLHDPSLRVRTRGLVARVLERDDGEFGLDITGEMHPEDTPLIAQLGGLSITLTAPLGDRDQVSQSPVLMIGANTAWFPDGALLEAETALMRSVPGAEAVRLYEFSFDPDPNIVVEMLRSTWALLGENALWDAIKFLFRGRVDRSGREAVPSKITIEIVDGEKSAYASLVTLDEQLAERAFQSLDHAVDRMFDGSSEASKVMWNEAEERWDDVS